MLKRFLPFITLILLFHAYHVVEAGTATLNPQKVTTVRGVTSFNKINIRGRIDVNLFTGANKPQLVLKGNPEDLKKISTGVKDQSLFLKIPDRVALTGPITADISTNHLNLLTYQGRGLIQGKNLRSRLLDLVIANHGRTVLGGQLYVRSLHLTDGFTQISNVNSPSMQVVLDGKARLQLNGLINLTDLDISGDGWLGMYWVKSYNLILRGAGSSFVQLGGIVEKLQVDLNDKARFNGRYLRANYAYVKTHGQSVAEISVVKSQHSLATDDSDIYFYNIPEMRRDFMAYHGAVLDMRNLSAPILQEYTRYNKH